MFYLIMCRSLTHAQRIVKGPARWGDQLSRREVALRVRLHCVPTAHETAGTLETGTLRLSFSDFNTPGEVERFLAVIARLI